ncbi:MAG TPA: glutamine synthetase family protein [Acidimicrobiales bacterium]|nr:glutamine synthetase family protein [Acidimicrobiales bacterium]
MTPEEAGAWLAAHGVTTVRTEGVSPDGLVLGKHLARAKFERSLPLGPAVSDIAFAYDLGGTPYLGWWDDWRQECLGDIHQRPDLATLVIIPHRPEMAACMVDHVDVSGQPLPVCPRSVLQQVLSRLESHGLAARAAFEIEGMVFAESYGDARAKGYRGLTPLGLPVPLGYTTQDAYRMAPFMDEVVRRLDGMGIPWEAWSAEAAPGQFEINLEPADPVTAADRTMRVRQVVREVAADTGRSATVMARPTDGYGNGTHIHHSLQRADGSAFHDRSAPDGRSSLMRHWIGGLLATMPAAHSILTPTVNSYRRLVPFAPAPTTVTWGEENKSVALRVVSRDPKLARVEHRVGAGDVCPHLALATILAGGLAGLEGGIDPDPETRLVAWGLPDRFPHLPTSIGAAADALEGDKALTDILGAPMVHHWVQTRRWEWIMFATTGGDAGADQVTDWELMRYFEIV